MGSTATRPSWSPASPVSRAERWRGACTLTAGASVASRATLTRSAPPARELGIELMTGDLTDEPSLAAPLPALRRLAMATLSRRAWRTRWPGKP